MIVDLNTFIVSDSHWGHGNIVKYARRPMSHNELMFDNWESIVRPSDVVLHLGDIAMTKGADESRIKALPGRKFAIPGNHDSLTATALMARWDISLLKPKKNGYGQRRLMACVDGHSMIAFSHEPLDPRDKDWEINIHGHIHVNGWPREAVESGRHYINVCVEHMHYRPYRLKDILSGKMGCRISGGPVNDLDQSLRANG